MLAGEFWDKSGEILQYLAGRRGEQYTDPLAMVNATAWVEDIPQPNTVMLAVLLARTPVGSRAMIISALETDKPGRGFIKVRVGANRITYDSTKELYTCHNVAVLTGRPKVDSNDPPVESVELGLAINNDTASHMGKYALNAVAVIYKNGTWEE